MLSLGGATLSTLLNSYGLRGAYLLWAGILLHIAIAGMLLKPSGEQKIRQFEVQSTQEIRHHLTSDFNIGGSHQSMSSTIPSIFSGRSNISRRPEFQRYLSHISQNDVKSNPMLRAVLHREVSKSHSASHSPAPTKRSYTGTSSPKAIGRFTIGAVPHDKLSSPVTPEFNDISPTITEASKVLPPSIAITDSLSQHRLSAASTDYTPGSPSSIRTGSELSSIFVKRLQSMSSQSHSQYTSMSHISHHQSIRDLFPKEYDNESLASTLVCALQPSDALTPKYRLGHRSISTIMGSILSLPTSLAIVKDDLSRIGDYTAVPDDKVRQ